MFGLQTLDVAIGLILVYLLLSLVASAFREGIEAVVKSRAVHLERGIRAIFDDPEGTGITTQFYRHPLVYSLFQQPYVPVPKRFRGGNLPAYIPARNFAVAVMDMAVRRPLDPVLAEAYGALQTQPPLTIDGLRAAVTRIDSPFVRRALRAAIDSAQGDVNRVQANLEAWYDSAMDRVSGWYKRRTQWILLAIGLASTVIVDVDTVRIAQHLYASPQSRAAAVALAAVVSRDSTFSGRSGAPADSVAALAREQLASLDLPIGWKGVNLRSASAVGQHVWSSLIGWIITALAISLGAPFWFDMLNKIMVVRSTVKPSEKSPEEGSEDRQPKGKPDDATKLDQAASTGAAIAAAITAATARAAAPDGTTPPPPAPTALQPDQPRHTPREWADGEEDGIL